MEDLFKKFLYTGVGLVTLTADKIQQAVNKLIDDNKISAEEGKKIVDDFIKNTQTKKDEFEAQLKSITERVVHSFDYASSEEVRILRERVDVLEKELKKGAKPAAPKKEKVLA